MRVWVLARWHKFPCGLGLTIAPCGELNLDSHLAIDTRRKAHARLLIVHRWTGTREVSRPWQGDTPLERCRVALLEMV